MRRKRMYRIGDIVQAWLTPTHRDRSHACIIRSILAPGWCGNTGYSYIVDVLPTDIYNLSGSIQGLYIIISSINRLQLIFAIQSCFYLVSLSIQCI